MPRAYSAIHERHTSGALFRYGLIRDRAKLWTCSQRRHVANSAESDLAQLSPTRVQRRWFAVNIDSSEAYEHLTQETPVCLL